MVVGRAQAFPDRKFSYTESLVGGTNPALLSFMNRRPGPRPEPDDQRVQAAPERSVGAT